MPQTTNANQAPKNADPMLISMLCPQETAINIGFACSLLRDDMTQFHVTAAFEDVEELERAGRHDDAYKLACDKVSKALQPAVLDFGVVSRVASPVARKLTCNKGKHSVAQDPAALGFQGSFASPLSFVSLLPFHMHANIGRQVASSVGSWVCLHGRVQPGARTGGR